MSYTVRILTKKPTSGKYWDIDRYTGLLMPIALCIGTPAGRLERWMEYLENHALNDKTRMHIICLLHKSGLDKGYLNLVCKCPMKTVHAQGLMGFIEKYAKAIEDLFPYAIPGFVSKTEKPKLILNDPPDLSPDIRPVEQPGELIYPEDSKPLEFEVAPGHSKVSNSGMFGSFALKEELSS